MSGSHAFGKTICSICYEDLKPIIEDLQAIPICGHVFHELCLQQWFEYCSKAKKTTCPVCKQRCCQENVGRLYFQSIGDPNDLILSQKPLDAGGDEEEDPLVLRREVKKLEGKLSGFSSAFDRQQQDLKQLNEELCLCKEHANKEAALRNETLQQKASIQQLLQSQSAELVKTSSECSRLQERNMALAKELTALKLVSDLNLDEEEVVKLASFGRGTNSKDTIDILKKSLVLRNKSYKELMAQCNLLGRGETRSLKKLERAEEKIKKLKTRVRELEMAIEEKDTKVLRALKASKKTSGKGVDLNGVKWNSNTPYVSKSSSEDHMEQFVEPIMDSNQSDGLTNHPFQFNKTGNSVFHKDLGVNTCKKDTDIIAIDLEKDFNFLIDENAPELPPSVHENSSSFLKHQTNASFSEDIPLQNSCMLRPRAASNTNLDASMNGQSCWVGLSGSRTGTRNDMNNASVGAMEDVKHISHSTSAVETSHLDEFTKGPHLLQIRKETSCPVPTPYPGDQCFAGGLLGPDGANTYLGKWCKRTQTKSSVGDLIAVGADGRGGRIKVLRSQNQSDGKGSSLTPKRCKYGAKQSGPQSQGCLQIEHFFGKADRS